MKLEEKITTLRKRNGWSQEELAFRLDVSRQAVSKWEMGASVPDVDKIVRMSELFGCTTDYLLKEETHGGSKELIPNETSRTRRQVCDEEGEEYLSLVKKIAPRIAIGVSLCILSPMTMFILFGFSELGIGIAENVAGGVGVAAILLVCALGVAFLVSSGIALSKFDYLEKEEIEISQRLEHLVRERKESENKAFVVAIAIGVSLCILSAVPLFLASAMNASEGVESFCLAGLFPLVASGVFLFIRFGMRRGSFSKLLQEEEYTVEKKKTQKRGSTFAGVYWCLTTAIYLGMSFWTGEWHRTWILWPVVGVLFAALNQIVTAVTKNKKK